MCPFFFDFIAMYRNKVDVQQPKLMLLEAFSVQSSAVTRKGDDRLTMYFQTQFSYLIQPFLYACAHDMFFRQKHPDQEERKRFWVKDSPSSFSFLVVPQDKGSIQMYKLTGPLDLYVVRTYATNSKSPCPTVFPSLPYPFPLSFL